MTRPFLSGAFKKRAPYHCTILYEVANYLNYNLFLETRMVLPLENSTFYDFWEKPLFEEDEITLVHEALQNYRDETEKWTAGGIENTWK